MPDVVCELTLLDLEGEFINDPETKVLFRRLDLGRSKQWLVKGANFSRGPVQIKLADATDSATYEIEVSSSRYHHETQRLYVDNTGGLQRSFRLQRHPSQWSAQFTVWEMLSDQFDSLRALLLRSPGLLLTQEGTVTSFVENVYDNVTTEAVRLTKTTLLNVFHELSAIYDPVTNKPLVSFLRCIEAIDPYHILALADQELEGSVETISTNSDTYRDWMPIGGESDRFYIPPKYRSRIVGTHYLRFQSFDNTLDLRLDIVQGADFTLLTAGITGRTLSASHHFPGMYPQIGPRPHPYDVHEWLIRAASGVKPDLGYRLLPSKKRKKPVSKDVRASS